jgi:hypothetical protein
MNRMFLWESQKERDHWEEIDVGGRIILKRNLEKRHADIWIGFIWLSIGTSEHCNETSGSTEF